MQQTSPQSDKRLRLVDPSPLPATLARPRQPPRDKTARSRRSPQLSMSRHPRRRFRPQNHQPISPATCGFPDRFRPAVQQSHHVPRRPDWHRHAPPTPLLNRPPQSVPSCHSRSFSSPHEAGGTAKYPSPTWKGSAKSTKDWLINRSQAIDANAINALSVA